MTKKGRIDQIYTLHIHPQLVVCRTRPQNFSAGCDPRPQSDNNAVQPIARNA
jgi:hypothetical protein